MIMNSQGLPENEFLYISSKIPLINVDLFVIDETGKVLLAWRDDEYCGTGWHIPGGIIRHGETMRKRLEETAKQELGFIPVFENNPCRITEIFLNQKYRNHFISHLYKCRCREENVKTVKETGSHNVGDLCWFDHYAGLVYSQSTYEEYLKRYFFSLHEKNCVCKQR